MGVLRIGRAAWGRDDCDHHQGREGCGLHFWTGDAVLIGRPCAQRRMRDCVRPPRGMSPIDYDRVRKAEAERLGVRVGTLDEEVARRRPKRAEQDEGIAGRALDLAAPEPWPQPVDGAMLLDEMVAQIRRYVMLPREAAAAIALWIVHCHGFDLFPITPRLLIEIADAALRQDTTRRDHREDGPEGAAR